MQTPTRYTLLQAVVDFTNYIIYNFTVTLAHANSEIRFADLCEPHCNMNKMLEIFLVHEG
jgi:hypothetical protein